ncbi:MAG: thymidylate synthase, partial [Bacteroidota bacterium]
AGEVERHAHRDVGRALPTLAIAAKPLDDLTFEDATLSGYNPHPAIRFPVAV